MPATTYYLNSGMVTVDFPRFMTDPEACMMALYSDSNAWTYKVRTPADTVTYINLQYGSDDSWANINVAARQIEININYLEAGNSQYETYWRNEFDWFYEFTLTATKDGKEGAESFELQLYDCTPNGIQSTVTTASGTDTVYLEVAQTGSLLEPLEVIINADHINFCTSEVYTVSISAASTSESWVSFDASNMDLEISPPEGSIDVPYIVYFDIVYNSYTLSQVTRNTFEINVVCQLTQVVYTVSDFTYIVGTSQNQMQVDYELFPNCGFEAVMTSYLFTVANIPLTVAQTPTQLG